MKFCTACHKAGPSLDQCGSHLTCPARSALAKTMEDPKDIFPDVDTSKSLVLHCDRPGCHGATVCFPIHDILKGKTQADFRCHRSPENCQATVISADALAVFAPPAKDVKKASKKGA